jgi:uncharacterized protein YukE
MLETLKNTVQELYATANIERQEMLALLARMQKTNGAMNELADLSHQIAEAINDIADNLADTANFIEDAMENPLDRCPTTPYEDLIGFCEDCGDEIVAGEDFSEDENGEGIICSNCIVKEEA